MVDIEHGALSAFKEDGLAFVESAVGEFSGIANEAFDFFGKLQGFFDFTGEIDVRAIGSASDAIFFGNNAGSFLAEEIGIEKISHAQASTSHLIFVGGTDTAGSGADFVGAAGIFRREVEFAMVRENDVGAIADVQAAFDAQVRLSRGFRFRRQERRDR